MGAGKSQEKLSKTTRLRGTARLAWLIINFSLSQDIFRIVLHLQMIGWRPYPARSRITTWRDALIDDDEMSSISPSLEVCVQPST